MADPTPPPAQPVLWRDKLPPREQARQFAAARRSRVRLALVLLLFFGAALTGVIVWLQPIPNPYFAPIWITDYQARAISPPPMAAQDRDALERARYFPRKSPRAYQSLQRPVLLQELDDLKKRSYPEDVVVYVTALARTGADDEVYVLPADADPDVPTSWLSLREILEKIKACPSRNKLLVLDVASPFASAQLGILIDDVGQGIQRTVNAIDDPHRLVLCSCSPGQTSLASMDMGRTVFGFYLEEGLRGYADGFAGKTSRDRRVSIGELATFVQARVDRWASRNRQARQSPMLIGEGRDFALIALQNGKPQAHLPIAEPAPYPEWLQEGWKLHDNWSADELYRTLPELYRELETALLESEKEWSDGITADRGKENREEQIKSLDVTRKLFRMPTPPEPLSLALGMAQGRKPDKETADLLKAVLAKRAGAAAPGAEPKPEAASKPEAPKAEKGEKGDKGPPGDKTDKPDGAAKGDAKADPAAKGAPTKGDAAKGDAAKADPAAKGDAAKPDPAAKGDKPDEAKPPVDPMERLKEKPHFDVAWAAFESLANDPNPQPDKIRFLNTLLQSQEPRPRFVETLFMQRLGEFANQVPAGNWPKELVHRALELVRQGEKAASQADVFGWIRALLDDAAQKRYDAETLFFARGYVSFDEADQAITRALDAYESCLAVAETLSHAQAMLDESMAFLPAYVPYLERVTRFEKDWQDAVQVASDLYRLLSSPRNAKPVPPESLRQKADAVRAKTEELRQRLKEMRQPFAADNLTYLITAGARADAHAGHLLQMQAVLATPALKAADRAAMVKAERALARRLHEQTVALDQSEDAGKQSVTAGFRPEGDPSRLERVERERAARRMRVSIELLRLGGLPASETDELNRQLTVAEAAGPTADWFKMGQLVRLAWTVKVPDFVRLDAAGQARDRVSRVFTTLDMAQLQRDSTTSPQVQLKLQQARTLYSWLAERSRYESRDLQAMSPVSSPAAIFEAGAARIYQQLASVELPEEEYLQLTDNNQTIGLPPGNPTAVYPFKVQAMVKATTEASATMRIVTADEAWLRVVPENPDLNTTARDIPLPLPSGSPRDVPLGVDLKPGAARSGLPAPRGFLVQATMNGRTYNRLVSVSLQGVTDRLEILLSANPLNPTQPVGDLRIRPIQNLQPYFLYINNPTPKARNLVVQLWSNDKPIPNAEFRGAFPPNEVRRVNFPLPQVATPPAAPAAGAPAAAPLPPDMTELTGPIEIRLLDTDNKNAVLAAKLVQVGVATPAEYVQIISMRFVPPKRRDGIEKNRLIMNLRTTLVGGPPCLVEMSLPPSRIPGFLGVKDGNFQGELPFSGEELKLYAEDIQLRDGADEEGFVYLKVDNCTRAAIFRTTFARSGDPTTPREDIEPALRIRAPAVLKTGAKLPVEIEADNSPAGARLDVSLGQFMGDEFQVESLVKLPTGRNTHVGFAPASQAGAMLFEASIRDWAIDVDTLRIRGPRKIRARLIAPDGTVIRVEYADVILDDVPPQRVRITEAPRRVRKDGVLLMKASCELPISGIEKVECFLGKPVDGKLPPNVQLFPATPAEESQTDWNIKVPLAIGQKGTYDFTVHVRSKVGLSSFATATVELTDTDEPVPGKIQGVVMEGTRPQANIVVSLLDEKNMVKDKTTTDEEGKFTFENVIAGRYKVNVSKSPTRRKGETAVTVEPDKTATVEIALKL